MEQQDKKFVIKRKGADKYCFVPFCESSSIKEPAKIFLAVPKGEKRLKWLQMCRRDPKTVTLQSSLYCCEDHFNVSVFYYY